MNNVYQTVCANIAQYCQNKGYCEGLGVNNLVPHDAIAAFGMARHLTSERKFDYYLAVAPEGHIYGYFFERFGFSTMDIFVPYPPVAIEVRDDLSCIKGKRVLIIEDDVMSGKSLQLVIQKLIPYGPAHIELYLGHSKGIQHPENVAKVIERIYFTEDIYAIHDPILLEQEFQQFFKETT
jgi:hypothetical protein